LFALLWRSRTRRCVFIYFYLFFNIFFYCLLCCGARELGGMWMKAQDLHMARTERHVDDGFTG
jgi:hypothetical protein